MFFYKLFEIGGEAIRTWTLHRLVYTNLLIETVDITIVQLFFFLFKDVLIS